MNVYDSIKMGDLLRPHGFGMVDEPEGADMVILNTCHIREKATEKVYDELGRISKEKELRKKNGENMLITVAGCVAQAEGEEIVKRAPFVDIVVGPQSYHNLPNLIEEVKRQKKWAMNIDFPTETKFDELPKDSGSQGPAAFLSVQEGCDKFCAFCVVPYTRGAEYSRPVAQIYREALHLASIGTKEVTLLGQNVSAYHGQGPDGDTWTMGKLIKHIATIKGIERIRYITSHPSDMIDDELFEAHTNLEKLMPFLHVPIQSGSNNILKAMNRKHSRDEYLKMIEKFRKARPDMAFSSDFIVGFPGETDKDFEDTMAIVREVGYSQCFSFNYSPRPGTPASALETQVPEDVKNERLYLLQELIREKQMEFNRNSIGQTMPVLFTAPGKFEGQVQGKSPYLQNVFVKGEISDLYGKICNVKINEALQTSLGGELE